VNTAESVVGVQTPLSWSFWERGGEPPFRYAYRQLGFIPRSALESTDVVDERFTAIFYGRAATNVTAFRVALDAMPFASADHAEHSFFSSTRSESGIRSSRWRRIAAGFRMPATGIGLPARLASLRRESEAFWRESMNALPEEDYPSALLRFEKALERFRIEVTEQIVASTIATVFSERLRKLILAAFAGGEANVEDVELRLLGGFGNLEEIRVSADLWEVARGDLDLTEFLARHGFRGPADGELSSYSWREDSRPVDALLTAYQVLPQEKSPAAAEARRAADREAAERDLLEGLHGAGRLRARMLLRLAARYLPLRVIAKAAFQQTFDVARASARRIGAILASEGRIEDAEDVFYLVAGELQSLPSDARARIETRRALRAEYEKLDLPLDFTGMPEPFPLQPSFTAASTEPVRGLGVSPGIVEGRARIVFEPGDSVLQPGEILVCSTTDPSWTSYMLLAAAVVIDVGGPLSHGAIVARELGIPCVINTADGTRRLRDGDRLRVDGTSGCVEILR
jgi:pyruvate,water dikinase